MWNLILADDEPIIVHGLQKIINWEQLGIHIVATCNDGASALELLIQHKPDLAILDINMPGKTGLEILEGLRAAHVDTKVIFISGYRQFEYALGAMQLGAVNLLLKPVNRDDLLSSVRKCLPIPDVQPEINVTNLPIIPPSVETLSTYLPVLYAVTSPVPSSSVERRLMEFAVSNEVETWHHASGIDAEIYDATSPVCLLFKNYTADRLVPALQELTSTIQLHTGNHVLFLIGQQAADVTQVPDRVNQLKSRSGLFYFDGWLNGTVLLPEQQPFKSENTAAQLRAQREKVLDACLQLNPAQFQTEYAAYCSACCAVCSGNVQAAQMRLLTLYSNVVQQVESYGKDGSHTDTNPVVSQASACHTYDQLVQLIGNQLKLFLCAAREKYSDSDKTDALRALNYIDEHYAEPLTLETMANHFHMNSSYFSSYFKKNTGKNFKEYLISVRLQHALQLLVSTNMHNYEIADAVGFNDIRSFTDQFQKIYHKTPQAYRKELRQEI